MRTFTGLRCIIKAFVTTIGERTKDLCIWALERNGFEVEVISGNTTLAQKLKEIYTQAEDDFIRVDADVVVNQSLIPVIKPDPEIAWWVQFMTYDWYKQDITHGGVNYISKEALPYLRANIDSAMDKERPESFMYRLEEFHNPRRCITDPRIMGIQNYKNNMPRVRQTKERRGQDGYDWKLVERLEEL